MNQEEDVEFILGYERHYKFHSGTLARNSALLADLLTEPNAAKLNSRAKHAGVKIRWMIELTRLPCNEYPAGCLELVELTSLGARADGGTGLIVNQNGRIPHADKTFDHYQAIFYAFYNKDLAIDDTDMNVALLDCYELLEISDYLGCTSLIRRSIEAALVKQGQDLFRAIRQSPIAWVEMSYRIQSELLFKECVIHLVGSWKSLKSDQTVRERLREIPGLLELIESYQLVLLEQCRRLELSILSHYPGNMKAPVEDLPIKTQEYSRDILIWMALNFFRHWFGQRLIKENGRHSIDCGYKLYKQIGTGVDSYMDKSIINQFHSQFPLRIEPYTFWRIIS